MSTANRELDSRKSMDHQDGLVDIFVGLAILTAGLYFWADMVWMAGVFIPIFLPAWKSAWERLVCRRVGRGITIRNYKPRARKFSCTSLY